MSEEIIKVLDAVGEKFGIAMNWSSENVVPYLQQLCGRCIKYEIATSILWIIIGITLLIISTLLIRKIKTRIKNNYNDDEDFTVLLGCIVVVLILVAIPIIIFNMFDLVTCFTFPEKVLIEEIQSIYQSLR